LLRVIAGEAKGTRLVTPKDSARPTLDRVRESVFSILHMRLPGARFLDLYAGSGANGIEALSRGAAWCAFADSNSSAINAIGENVFRAKLGHKCRSYQLTLPAGLGVVAKSESQFDIIYCDPPYVGTDYLSLLLQLKQNKLLTDGGMILVEHDLKASMPAEETGFSITREARYGRVGITFFS